MIYLFDKDEKLIKIVRKSAVKTALQKYALTTERYVSDRLTVELKGLNADELEQVEYMAIQTMEDAHTFHYFYVAQKSSDELTTLIGVQSGIEELRKSPVYDKRPQNAFARDVITDLLAGTNWQARFVGETTPHSTNFYYTSVFDALKKVCEVWDLEMQFFVEMNGNRIGGRYIDFKQRIGQAVGKRVVYGHNALQILQEVERTNIFTALVGRGKGEETGAGYGRKITFEDVTWSTTQGKPVDKPAGQKYLELPLMTRQYGIKNADGSMRPKIGFVDFSEEENPEILIERTYKALIDAARPQLTLKTSSVYLKGVKIGDTIRVVRHDKKLDYDTRIFEITFNRLNNQSSDIKLGDRIGESNEAKAQTIADKAVEQFVNNEFSNFVQNLPDYLPSADGFNNNWYGAEDPTVQYPGKVLINDIWFKPDPEHEGHKIMLRWTGEVWEEILRTYDSEALRDRIAEEITQVNQSMQAQSEEHDRQVADILSKTVSNTDLANQAKSFAERAQVNLDRVRSNLEGLIGQANTKAGQLEQSVGAIRTDITSQARSILEQARAQTALTDRVTTVETLADGTRSTVAELSKTVSKATGDIASVSSRTKTVEDTLSQTRTQYEALTQTVNAQTGQIESINRKTADLQSGIDGVTERFESLQVGGTNLLSLSKAVKGFYKFKKGENIPSAPYAYGVPIAVDDKARYVLQAWSRSINDFSWIGAIQLDNEGQTIDNSYLSFYPNKTSLYFKRDISILPNAKYIQFSFSDDVFGDDPNLKIQFEKGSLPTDYKMADEDQQSYADTKIAEYKNTVDGQFVNLQTQVNDKAAKGDVNGLAGRLTTAETSIQTQAGLIEQRLTATQVEQAISAKGFATTAVVENKVRETADSFSRTISETKALIPTEVGGANYFSGYQFNQEIILGNYQNVGSFIQIYDRLTFPLPEADGKTFTISFEAISPNGDTVLRVYNANEKPQYFYFNTGNIGTATNTWKKFKVTVKPITQATYTSSTNSNRLEIYAPSKTGVKVRNIKVELGTVATDWSPAPEDLATVTALHSVRDTVDSHTRTIGAVGTAGSILDNVSKVTQTAAGLVQEVSGTNGLKTQVSQLAGSYAIKNLTNSGTVLNQLNLNKDGSVKIDGKLVQITGTTYIQDGVITSAKIAGLDAGKITTGTLDAGRINVINLNASSIVGLDASFIRARIEHAITSLLEGKVIRARNGAMLIDLNNARIDFNRNATINFNSANNALVRRKGTHTAFVHFNDVSSSADSGVGSLYASIGVTSSGDGINSGSSGRFCGARFFRGARGYEHAATVDQAELYGDYIILKDGFDGNRGFRFQPTTIDKMIDMNYLVSAVRALGRCWLHMNNVRWDPRDNSFGRAVINEYNSHIKNL